MSEGFILNGDAIAKFSKGQERNITFTAPVDDYKNRVVNEQVKAAGLVWPEFITRGLSVTVGNESTPLYWYIRVNIMGVRLIRIKSGWLNDRVFGDKDKQVKINRKPAEQYTYLCTIVVKSGRSDVLLEYELDVYRDKPDLRFVQDYLMLVEARVKVGFTQATQLGTSLQASPTSITILAKKEAIRGQNISCVFFKSSTGEWVHRPLFTYVVRGSGCSLLSKYASPEQSTSISSYLEEYGLLRYFILH